MSQEEYYRQHFPRYDKLDDGPILFKSRSQYFSTDFNSRVNLRDWLQRVPLIEAQDYIRNLLLERKFEKQLIYTLSQVELRSLLLPGMAYMGTLFGDYYQESKRIGFKNRYSQTKFSGVWKTFSPHHKIVVDTREQLPLDFDGISTIHTKIDAGDYQLNDNVFTHNCCIERKSLNDLYGTLGKDISRFEKEIIRAHILGWYLVVLVENPLEAVYKLSDRFTKVAYVLHNIRAITQKYSNIQFLFVGDRDEASEVIQKLFLSDGQYKDLDLQYAYDTGGLI